MYFKKPRRNFSKTSGNPALINPKYPVQLSSYPQILPQTVFCSSLQAYLAYHVFSFFIQICSGVISQQQVHQSLYQYNNTFCYYCLNDCYQVSSSYLKPWKVQFLNKYNINPSMKAESVYSTFHRIKSLISFQIKSVV